ncbi:hypothetical protein ACIA49_21720 [Kribbella sp. NPDC051587]|uniref:hypothetical protein n=1 Tax=Kribbella sp. NPDC051587 TaxID=3364119 RepID=UPI003791C1D8
MNEQELRERMQTSVLTEFAPDAIDPAADVARGRRGLRRRRVAGGVTAAAGVAAVAALGAQYLPTSSAEAPVAQTSKPPVAQTSETPVDHTRPYAIRVRYLALVVASAEEHLGRSQKYVPGKDRIAPTVVADGKELKQVTFRELWKQSGGTGALWVTIAQPKQALPKEKWCGPNYTPDLLRMTCSERLAPNGRRVTVGAVGAVKNSAGLTYRESGGQFIRYVRPDGQVVIVAALGMNSLKRVADGLPKGVKHPDVTWQQLAAVATDPTLTLGK